MHLALSHPEVAFIFLNNGQEKLRTSGSGKLKDVIYNVYGRDVAANLIDIDYEKGGLRITGYLGKPVITRGNRNFENFFVNGRYVKSPMISKSLEDAYRDFTMQHKFPFAVLHFHVDGEQIDVNVHPTKMELRFQRQQEVYNTVFEGVHRRLLEPELIQKAEVPDPVTPETKKEEKARTVKESPFLLKPRTSGEAPPSAKEEVHDEDYFIRKMRERVMAYHRRASSAEVQDRSGIYRQEQQADDIAFEYTVKAGYNIGAGAATWQRFIDKMGVSKTNFVGELFSPSDHPSHQSRRDNYSEKLTEYSNDKVEVDEKTGMIRVNRRDFIIPAAANDMSSQERAYLIAGNLAAVYHATPKNPPKAHLEGDTIYMGRQAIMVVEYGENGRDIVDYLNAIR